MSRRYLAASGILALLAVILGTLGSHVLPKVVSASLLETFDIGVRYHFHHALGLGIVALAVPHFGLSGWFLWSARIMVIAVCLFSGSLYLLVITGQQWFALITPLGGVGFLIAWCLFIAGILKSAKK